MSKKILAMLLCVCMVMSLAMPTFAADFTDTDSHWAEAAIDRWVEHGLVEGVGGDKFDPNGSMTRGQAAALFARLLKLEAKADISNFEDVNPDAWYAEYIAMCVEAGIMNGVGDNMMDPGGTLSREQMMTMLCRALGIQPEESSDKEFSDSEEVSPWAEGYVNALVNAGIVSGLTEDTLAPDVDINRASMMALLDKSIVVYADEEGETVSVGEGTGIVVIVADNVTVENAPAGTVVVTGAETTGTEVNGTEVDKDTVHEVEPTPEPEPEPEPEKPVIVPHFHRYDNWVSNNDGTHTGTCVCKVEKTEDCEVVDGTCSVCEQTYIAAAGDGYYTTLADAIAAADGGEVELFADVSESLEAIENVTFSTKVEGGVTITNSFAEDEWIPFNNVTLKSGVTLITPNVLMNGAKEYGSTNLIEGTLVTGTDGTTGTTYYQYNDAKTTIQNGGKVVVNGDTVLRYNYNTDSGIFIYGDGDESTVEYSCGLYAGGYIGAYSGTFYAEDAVVNTGDLRLDYKKGSSEEADKYAPINAEFVNSAVSVAGELRLYKDATMNLEGTEVTAGKVQVREAATPVVTMDADSCIKAASVEIVTGALVNAILGDDGTVTFEPMAAKVGNVTYPTFEAAIAAAQNGDTVTLLDNITASEIITIDKAITLDLNGKTLNGNVIGTIKMNGGKFSTVADAANGLRAYNMVAPADYEGGDYAYLSTDGVFTMTLRDAKIDLTFEEGAVALANNWQTDTNQVVTIASGASFTVPEGKTFLIQYGTEVVVNGTVAVGGTVAMQAETTLKAPEGLNVVGADTTIAVTYADGTYTAVAAAAKIGSVGYATLADAVAAAEAGDEIIMLADVEESVTVPAGVIFNGNGFNVEGTLVADGDITFVGITKADDFDVANNSTVTIGKGASLQLDGSARMSIGLGATFNITGTITDAKTANTAELTPSLIMPGASFTGAGVTFNVTNAYIKTTAQYCSSSKYASGTFDFNIENSIWEQFGKLAFESQSTAATVNFDLKDSVLTTTSHLVFGVSRGEVVIDNSNVNVGTSNQIENQSTMTIKNGSVVNGAVATSSNAKNPGTLIVDNATYAVTGEFSGSDLGTGTLIVRKGAIVSAGSITKANIVVDATGMAAGDEISFTANLTNLAGTLSVSNNDNLEANIVDGKIVLAEKPVATGVDG